MSSTKAKFVSVLIDTYNHERFIEEAIVSVLEQDFPASEMEILVVDDGSTDRTPEILRKFAPRVRVLTKKNGGQASAFNAGIPEAHGEIVAFLDGDDWWAHQKLTRVMLAFESNPAVGVVGHAIVEVDTGDHVSKTVAPGTIDYFDLSSDSGAQSFRDFMPFLGTSRVSIRKSALERVLPIPEALTVEADEFMSTMAVAASGAVLVAEPLTFYRLHSGNLYQFRQGDSAKSRRKLAVLECLARELPIRLPAVGVSESAIHRIADPLKVSAKRMRLSLDGGYPWETFQAELQEFRIAYKTTSTAYRIFKYLSLGTTLLVSPRLFYRLRDWYSTSGFRKIRGVLGEPIPRADIAVSRQKTTT
jgi:glycosyltransferase involved in cell wall biosynthesis